MNLNIEANKTIFQMDVEARELKWGSEISSKDLADIDVVVVADCIYYEEVGLTQDSNCGIRFKLHAIQYFEVCVF